MELVLRPEMFINDVYTVSFGDNKEAIFTIVDDEFQGDNKIGRVNRINALVRTYNAYGAEIDATLCTTVIGVGDGIVGVKTENSELLGKLMTSDNMKQCVVILYD